VCSKLGFVLLASQIRTQVCGGTGLGSDAEEASMSIFGSIMSAIFGSKASAAPAAPSTGAPSAAAPSAAGPSPAAPAAPAAATAAAPMSIADVEAMIANIEQSRGVKYNWRQSIVDLMKLLDLDSGLGARKQLAQELGYTGALDGSAEMNVWLHKQVMEKLAASGGKVPESLKH
jgi:3-oxoacyl-ACP reductase-like protein